MRLTRGKLLKQPDWTEWQASEYTQLEQYDRQGMFGNPVAVTSDDAVFNLVWTYVVKELDKRKKARCTCDGSTRSGQVRVLDYTYANCVDQTSSRLFYAVSAAENLQIYGADVSNAFGEAPPPKQGFYIRPDKAFTHWWVNCKGRAPIQHGHVIPILAAMQGHPEAGRLWEKHADAILRSIGLTPTIHEPCLYSGIVNGDRVIFLRQVDDFAVAAPSERTANILFDLIDDRITFPLKRMGLIDMFNGLDIAQTKHYIKLSCRTYIKRISTEHLATWMSVKDMPNRPTPLPSKDTFMRDFLSAQGTKDDVEQAKLAKEMGFGYRKGIGQLIYPYMTCRPDLSYAVVRASQYSSFPAPIHYHGVRHALKYLYCTRDDGIYFWRTTPNDALPDVPPPPINSNAHDLLHDGRPIHDALDPHGYMDSDWGACLRTRRSFGGTCIRLAGGPIAYRSSLQKTVASSSTEAEFMEASDTGKMMLFVRSIMNDLGIPQGAASLLYENNDACTAIGNVQKPTNRTRHIDIRYFALCEWIERDLLFLERIDTTQNMSDHFTKQLNPVLFARHTDYVMGRIPPEYSPCFPGFASLRKEKKRAKPRNTPLDLSEAHPAAAAAARLSAAWTSVLDILQPRHLRM
ncbi:hypothetical protein ACHAWF_018275 [Thalassiosira exigua]